MKKNILFTIISLIPLSSMAYDYEGSSFAQVWKTLVTTTPDNKIYVEKSQLPSRVVSMKNLLKDPVDIFTAAKIAMFSQEDLFATRTKKLIRPNGICLSGKWTITEETPYTGYFAKGSQALIIARASVAFEETESGNYRSFGMAGKIFPTLDSKEKVKTANFFLIDDNAGTLEENYTNAELLTEAKLTGLNIVKNFLKEWSITLIKRLSTVKKAQKEADSHYTVRQLYPLSRIGTDIKNAKTPGLMKIVGSKSFTPVKRADFREELRVTNYPNFDRKNSSDPSHVLIFDIFVADQYSKEPRWGEKPIGRIEFTEDIVSDNCDERLRFAHPWWDDKAK